MTILQYQIKFTLIRQLTYHAEVTPMKFNNISSYTKSYFEGAPYIAGFLSKAANIFWKNAGAYPFCHYSYFRVASFTLINVIYEVS